MTADNSRIHCVRLTRQRRSSVNAWKSVDQLEAQGRLSGPVAWLQGAAYVEALRAFLSQHGYCEGPGAGPG
jgi:hypothetical protein